MIAPLSTGASHTVLGLAGAAAGMLVVWIAGSALAPARPPAERLAWGVVAMLAVAWSTLWQPVLGVSWLGQRALKSTMPPSTSAPNLDASAWRKLTNRMHGT